jgi:dTDP-4-amino-4,6-dideoxygalactose transaminase
MNDIHAVRHNYSYFPIFVDEKEYGTSRDKLYEKLKANNIFGRRYFYPLISEFSTYRGLESAKPENLPVATKIANSVISLPIHHELKEIDIMRIINIIG